MYCLILTPPRILHFYDLDHNPFAFRDPHDTGFNTIEGEHKSAEAYSLLQYLSTAGANVNTK